MRWILAAAIACATVGIGTASANNFAFFERVKVSELKEKGEVVGAQIKLTLRPDSTNYKGVKMGIAPGNGASNSNNRVWSIDPKAGVLLHQFPAITDIKPNQPKEITLKLKYKDAKKITPGQQFQIVSAWYNGDGKSASHVYGPTRTGFVTEKSYTLPKAKKTANAGTRLKDASTSSTRTRSTRARTTRRKAPAKKKPARTRARSKR
jgi:hypothetical protein